MSDPIELPLRSRYTDVPTPKFGGKKKNKSNEGGVGRVAKRAKRSTVPGSSNSRKKRSK